MFIMVDKEAIRAEAKEVMDNFMKALGKVDIEEEFNLKRETCYREERDGKIGDDDFKQRFLENAPKISGGAIVANRGEWTK